MAVEVDRNRPAAQTAEIVLGRIRGGEWPVALHHEVVAAAHNVVMLELFDGFLPRVRFAIIEMLRLRPIGDHKADDSAHGARVEAIADRDPAAASHSRTAHLSGTHGTLS